MILRKRNKADRPEISTLEIMARRSRAMLLVERALRLGAALAALALFFLALSWSGIWLHTGPLARMIGVALFLQAALTLTIREILRGWPSRRLALKRLDAGDDSGLRPAASLDDRLAAGRIPDPATTTLWELHRQRLEKALEALPIAAPKPEIEKRDPYALRALALVAAVGMAFVAGDEKSQRLAAAFDWRGWSAARETVRFDAWIDPPPYTGRQALVLDDKDIGQARDVPVNSALHVRFSGVVETEGALRPLVEQASGPKPKPGEHDYKLTGAARLNLPDGRAFQFTVIPDQPPTIEMSGPPKSNLRGSMTLAYKTQDDYGVVGAQALLSLPNGGRVLYPPPSLPLSLPPEQGGRGETQTTLDLSDSPWAGAEAILTLEARDEGGNVGVSQPLEITVPRRHFRKPLARALAEQRRKLALDPDDRGRVRLALEALSIAPDAFDTPSSIYLGLRMARRGLDGDRDDDQLREVADLLWAMALSLEDGDLSQAERDLRAAQRNLREALARGADDEEIAKLTQELREAMAAFLQGMSEQAKRDRDPGAARSQAGEGREVTKEDLDKMLAELDQASKSGDSARARQLLDQLTDLLENLQSSQGSQGKSAQSRERGRALSELDQLSREQQQLRDETYRDATQDENSEARPQAGRNGARKAAAERQQALRQRLERQREALRHSGEGAPGELEEADKAMKEAEQALEQGKSGANKALEAQGRALQALRRGADELAQRGKDGEGQGGAESDGGQPGQSQGRSGSGQDPLGRTPGAQGQYDSRSRYDPLGLPPAQRARRVQEEVRRRLGQPERPAEELDYLQRLLRR